MKAIFHPEAHEEMIESARFYEGKSAGFGLDFLSAVEKTTRRIEQFPKAGQVETKNIRKRMVPGFPLQYFMKYSPIVFSSPRLCIYIAGLVTGENACGHRWSEMSRLFGVR